MRRTGLAMMAALSLLVAACGGSGGGSPSEPGSNGIPVSLDGIWAGTISVNNQGSCTVTLTLDRSDQVFVGNWRAECANGQQGTGVAVVTPLFADQVIVSALPLQAQAVFGGCGWSSTATRSGNRLRGDWSTPQNCSTGPALRGTIDLTKGS